MSEIPYVEKVPGELPRLLVLDIENLPLSANTWGLFDQTIGLNQVHTDWSICSVTGKLVGDSHTEYIDTWDRQDLRDDTELVARVCGWLHNADVVIGHNLRKFDIRKLRARAIYSGLPPFREPKIIDTLRMAKEVAAFTSNKLEYLASHLTKTPKSAHAKFPGFSLWSAFMQRNPDARAEMREYNIDDVLATEELYLALRPWAKTLPNLAHYYPDDTRRCPRCGDTDLHEDGLCHLAVGEYQQFRCGGCGGLSRARSLINSKSKRASILACV